MLILHKTFMVFLSLVIALTITHALSYQIETPSTLYVGGKGPGNYTSIQKAIESATPGSTVMVYKGVYHENIIIDKPINLVSEEEAIIDGNNTGNVIHITSGNVSISGFTIQNSGIPQVNKTKPPSGNASIKEEPSGGIGLSKVKKNRLFNDTIEFAGIFIESDDVVVDSCKILSSHIGIMLRNGSNNLFDSVLFLNNSIGLEIIRSNSDTIHLCDFQKNNGGVALNFVDSSEIVQCRFYHQNGVAISLNRVTNSFIHHNEFRFNEICIVLINNCDGNVVFQNNFRESIAPSHVRDNCNNSWDNGVYGNYWDDYLGVDINGDGIGEDPYDVPLVSIDRYPLVSPVDVSDIGITVNILYPRDGDEVYDVIEIRGRVLSGPPIIEVKYKLDDEEWIKADGTSSWKGYIDTTEYENGYHDLYVYALNSNNESFISHIQILINNTFNKDMNKTPWVENGLFLIIIIIAMIFTHKSDITHKNDRKR